MVESIYYHPEIQRRVAIRQVGVVGGDPNTRLADATAAAIAALTPHAQRLGARVIEKGLGGLIDSLKPTQPQIVAGTPVAIAIDVAALLATQEAGFQAFIASGNIQGLICGYPVRETAALAEIARRLGFTDMTQNEDAVRKLLIDDDSAVAFVRELFGTLYADISA